VIFELNVTIFKKMLMSLHGDFCSDVGIYDRVVIQELLKTVAQSHQLDSSSQREFKGLQHSICLLVICC